MSAFRSRAEENAARSAITLYLKASSFDGPPRASLVAARSPMKSHHTSGAKITRKIKHFPEALAWFSNSKSGSPIVFMPF
jgi:hypothetical protein